jgi:hypothetical protein
VVRWCLAKAHWSAKAHSRCNVEERHLDQELRSSSRYVVAYGIDWLWRRFINIVRIVEHATATASVKGSYNHVSAAAKHSNRIGLLHYTYCLGGHTSVQVVNRSYFIDRSICEWVVHQFFNGGGVWNGSMERHRRLRSDR